MSNYHIVLCSDSNYFRYVFVLLQSLFNTIRPSYGSADDTVSFHLIVNDDVNIEQQSKICDEFALRNEKYLKSEFHLYKVDDELFSSCSSWGRDFPESKATYYRLLIDRVLPENIDTVLYLDVDMMFVDDFRLIFDNNDVSDYLLGGVVEVALVLKDYPVEKKSGKTLDYDLSGYINGGLLLLNLKASREIKFSTQLMDFVATHNVTFHDQTAINYLCYSGVLKGNELFKNGPILLIDYRYNFMQGVAFVELDSNSGIYNHFNGHVHPLSKTIEVEEYQNSVNNIVLVHFNLSKPWKPKAFGFNDQSCYAASALFDRFYSSWYQIANVIPEIPFKFNLNARDVIINSALSDVKQLLRKRYRSNRMLIIYGLAVLLVLQVIFFILSLIL